MPLFSGFMYAAVGSYIARILRIFALRPINYPPKWQRVVLAVAIYVNFFSRNFVRDARLALFALTAIVFRRTWLEYWPFRNPRRMPMLLGYVLVAPFIWIAENVATFSNAWLYSHQVGGWVLVPLSKLGAWLLLMIISFVLIASLHDMENVGGKSAD